MYYRFWKVFIFCLFIHSCLLTIQIDHWFVYRKRGIHCSENSIYIPTFAYMHERRDDKSLYPIAICMQNVHNLKKSTTRTNCIYGLWTVIVTVRHNKEKIQLDDQPSTTRTGDKTEIKFTIHILWYSMINSVLAI